MKTTNSGPEPSRQTVEPYLTVHCQIRSQVLTRGFGSTICGLHANLDELAVAGSDYDVLSCVESKVSDRRHLSELRIPSWLWLRLFPTEAAELHS